MVLQAPLWFGLAAGVLSQVTISVDASQSLGEWTAVNRFFGCDEPNYAYYPKGKALMKEIGALSKNTQTFFRTHNLLTTGNSTYVGVPGLKFGSTNIYTLDDDGKPVYNYTIIDEIFDSFRAECETVSGAVVWSERHGPQPGSVLLPFQSAGRSG